MEYTDYYNLRKPQMAETASVSDLNFNADKIDKICADNRQISVAMYVSGNTYNIGDLVGYENASNRIHIYKCLQDNVTGSWDATKWEITTLADEVLEAKASGGTEVEANPTGTPTDTLQTIGIDGTVYEIEGGGGGGSVTYNELTQAEYDALTDAQKKNGELYFITDVNGDGSQFQPVIYSTEEREIGVWTDGKPLYQKTVHYGSVTAQTTSIPLGIANVDHIHLCAGGSYINNNKPLPYIHYQTTYLTGGFFSVDTSDTSFQLRVGAQNITEGISSVTITVQYTKTTDTAGSGTWTPQGVPAVHYSTDEHVVGTWIDRSTLYEKTLIIPKSSISSGSGTYTHGISDIYAIIDYETTFVYSNGSTNKSPANPGISGWLMQTRDITATGIGYDIQASAYNLLSYIYVTLQYTKSSS